MARRKAPSSSPSSKVAAAAAKDPFTELADLSAQLAALEHASLGEMREGWTQVSDKPVPNAFPTCGR